MSKKLIHIIPLLISLILSLSDNIQVLAQEPVLDLHPGINNIVINHDGLSRELYILLPGNFDEEKSYPLLFYFHGYGGNREGGRDILSSLLETEEFIGISPQGIEESWNEGSGAVPSKADDIGFVLEVINQLEKSVKVSQDQIYTFGYSNGGALSYLLAMKTDKFAAFASFSATLFQGVTIPREVPKISALFLHGDKDIKVPYNGGQSSALEIVFQSAMETVLHWARHNKLGEDPVITNPEDNLTKDTVNPYEVILYTLEETTHHIVTHDLVKSNRYYQVIWDFLKRHKKN